MLWLKVFLFRVRSSFRKEEADSDLSEEIRLHLEMQTESYIASGMSPEEARLNARKEFGCALRVREESRAERSFVWLAQLVRDLRFAVVSLGRAPAFTIGVIVTLAIGIGVTTAMVSFALSVYQKIGSTDERAVVLTEKVGPPDNRFSILYSPRYAAYAAATQSFETLGATATEPSNLVFDAQPYQAFLCWVSRGVNLDVPELGRLFLPEEFKSEEEVSVALLGHETWVRFFGGDPGVIGKDVLVKGRLRKVIGIQKENPGLPGVYREEPSVTLPVVWKATAPKTYRMYDWVMATGRLKPGVTLAQAQAELAGLKIGDSGNAGLFSDAVPELTREADKRFAPPVFKMVPLFLGAVFFVYLIACTNAINLMFVRSISRRHELGVRLSLGGTRWQIMRLLLAESFILSLCAGVAGILLARWGGAIVCSYLSIPADESFNFAPLGIVFAFVCLTGLLIGLVPALRVGRVNVSDALKAGPNALGSNRSLGLLKESFIVLQTALVVTLLAGAGLMLQSLIKLNGTGVGFDPEAKVSVSTYLPFTTPFAKYLEISSRLKGELEAIPGVRRVSSNTGVPLGGSSSATFKIEGRPELGEIPAHWNAADAQFFGIMGVPLLKGRGFEGVRSSDSPVVIVNETMETRYFQKDGALGKHLNLGSGNVEIIGVVKDTRESGPREDAMPQIYQPLCQQKYQCFVSCLVELQATSVPGLEAMVRRAAFKIDPSLLMMVKPLEAAYREALSVERFTLVLLQVFSGLSLLLASLGLFSVMAYNVAQRRREFGLRLAMGATPEDLLLSVLFRGIRTVSIGIMIGLGLSLSISRFLQCILYETSPLDPLTYVCVVLLLFVVAFIACWFPARRAALTDPMVLLRCQ